MALKPEKTIVSQQKLIFMRIPYSIKITYNKYMEWIVFHSIEEKLLNEMMLHQKVVSC